MPYVRLMIYTSLALFVAAGVCEIGGGYLIWLWLRAQHSAWLGVLGAAVLFLYGVLPTWQPTHFGRVYAAYGGVFVVMSLLWGWALDGHTPDRWDWTGATLCIAGVAVIMYTPRS
jgi:small multidrug resistance family-3 protein